MDLMSPLSIREGVLTQNFNSPLVGGLFNCVITLGHTMIILFESSVFIQFIDDNGDYTWKSKWTGMTGPLYLGPISFSSLYETLSPP